MSRSVDKNNSIKTFTCIGCGITVSLRRQSGSTKYCSSKCFGTHKSPRKRLGEIVSCAQCHKEFYLARYRIINPANNFCSRECANLWQGRNKVEKTCVECGKAFRLSPSWKTFHAGMYCSLKCRDNSPMQNIHLIQMNLKQQREKTPNKLESWGIKVLEGWNVPFVPQALIGQKFVVDVLIPSLGIVIQWDGDYWHGYRKNGDLRPFDLRQKKRMALDISQDAYMKRCGYIVLRYWEHEVYGNPDGVKCDLLTAFQRAERV